jgi:hypothetical protein
MGVHHDGGIIVVALAVVHHVEGGGFAFMVPAGLSDEDERVSRH